MQIKRRQSLLVTLRRLRLFDTLESTHLLACKIGIGKDSADKNTMQEAFTDSRNLASTILYLPVTPFGLPLTPLFAPRATTTFISFLFGFPVALPKIFCIVCDLSLSLISGASIKPSAFFLAFSNL